MKKSIWLFSFLLFVSILQPGRAQSKLSQADSPNDVPGGGIEAGGGGDQVIEMLDSLVNIRYISRLNLRKYPQTRNNFQPSDIPSYSDEVIRQRLGRILSPVQMTYNDQVKKYIELYVHHRRDLTSIALGLSRLYFPMFEQVLDQYGLPLELKYLAVVESALNPLATSRVGATGLWQFMYTTGKSYNLEINSYIDERRDAYKSTVAACQYLKEMYAIYHDWLLVIASYNCGPGNVNKAIIRSGGKTSFWEICKYLPKETRGYVPAFIAVNYMMNYAADHNIPTTPSVISFLEVDTLNISRKLSLADVAAAIGVTPELIRFLNPVYKKSIIPTGFDKPNKLILPANKVATFLANADVLYKGGDNYFSSPVITKVRTSPIVKPMLVEKALPPAPAPAPPMVRDIRKIYIIKSGEDINDIAQQYECSTDDIQKWNHMKNLHVRNGQRLIIYLSSETQERLIAYEERKTDKHPVSLAKTKIHYIYHVVQRGDTLWTIAQKYEGVTVEQLKQINRIHSSSRPLKPGTKIKVALMS